MMHRIDCLIGDWMWLCTRDDTTGRIWFAPGVTSVALAGALLGEQLLAHMMTITGGVIVPFKTRPADRPVHETASHTGRHTFRPVGHAAVRPAPAPEVLFLQALDPAMRADITAARKDNLVRAVYKELTSSSLLRDPTLALEHLAPDALPRLGQRIGKSDGIEVVLDRAGWLRRWRDYRLVDPDHAATVTATLGGRLGRGDTGMTPQETLLCALIRACDMDHHVFPGADANAYSHLDSMISIQLGPPVRRLIDLVGRIAARDAFTI
jgi:hypothetical protein